MHNTCGLYGMDAVFDKETVRRDSNALTHQFLLNLCIF